MAFSTMISMTYQILGEPETYSATIPITAEQDMSIFDIQEQLQNAADGPEMSRMFEKFGRALIEHLARNTKEDE
jgi:hypothetical protein